MYFKCNVIFVDEHLSFSQSINLEKEEKKNSLILLPFFF